MTSERARIASILLAGFGLLLSLSASALIMTGRGNDPVHDAGWPEGALAVANLKSRVGWWEGPPFGGGEWHFLYRGDTAAFQNALTAFAAIRAPALDLAIHDGPEEEQFLKDPNKPDTETRVDWTFTVWNPASWHHLFNNPKSVFSADHPNFRQPVDPPRLDVHIGGGQIDWSAVKVPAGLRVRDERAAAAGFGPASGAVVRADVFDMASGKPVAGARLIVARMKSGGQNPQTDYETVAEAVSDRAGRVLIEKTPAGTCRLSVQGAGHAPLVLGYERFGPRGFKQFQAELAKPATVRGQVMDTSGRPVPGVRVMASRVMGINGRGYSLPATPEAVTDQAGQFELAGLPTGYAQVRAHASGYHFGDIFTIYEVPSTNIVLRLAGAGMLRVRILDKQGKPLARFEGNELHVSVEPKGGSKIGSWGGGARVGDDCTVEFKDVPAGEYRVTSRPNPGSSTRQYAPEQIVKVEPGVKAEVKIVYE